MAAVGSLPLAAFLFLFVGLGILAQSPVSAEGSPESEEKAITSLDHIRTQVDNNALALSQLGRLLESLYGFMEENPCIESEVTNHIADVMAEGFTDTMVAMRQISRAVRMLQLTRWRIEFVKSLGVPKIDHERQCPLPFFMLDDECIYVETKVTRAFRYAKLICSLMGGFLAEPARITEFAQRLHGMNIGRNAEVYIGAAFSPSTNTWTWQSNGATIQDIPFATGRPDRSEGHGCLVAKEMNYRDTACSMRKLFACEIAV